MRLTRTSVCVAPVLIGLLLGSCLVGVDRLGFRDVSHFYTPLYDYVAWRSGQQWLPLWNPLDQTGMPLLGETTTAVCYPIRYAVYSLPIPTEIATAWYVALHLVLASWTAFLAARWSRVGALAASTAGLTYSLSGAVLFLYTNPTFLAGAAWLPLVVGSLLAQAPMPALKRSVIAGSAMAMMILGGDPQTAAHAMIIVVVFWLARVWNRSPDTFQSLRIIVASLILASVLAAPQIAASVSWSLQSDRISDGGSGSWFQPPIVGSKRYEAYQYSLAPWHVMELATPNAFGSILPINHRISRLIPGDGRTWTPSIYMGSLVVLVLLSRLIACRKRGLDRWTAIAGMSLLLSIGHFGLVWVVQAATGMLPNVDSAAGGAYWWLYQCLPGYDSFRYPAKWLSPFALGAALSAATWLDAASNIKTFKRVAIALLATQISLWLIVQLLCWNPSLLLDANGTLPKDEFWGPLDVAGALAEISRSLIHSSIALGATLGVIQIATARRWSGDQLRVGLLVIVSVDLLIGGYTLVARIPRSCEQRSLTEIGAIKPADDLRWMRTQSGGGWPDEWTQTGDPNRLVDVESSLRAAWFGRWHLWNRAPVLNNMVSIRSQRAASFWAAAGRITANMSPQQREDFWRSMRRWLSIGGIVHTTANSVEKVIDGRNATLVQRIVTGGAPVAPLRPFSDWRIDSVGDLSPATIEARLREIHRSQGVAIPLLQGPGVDDLASNDVTAGPHAVTSKGASVKVVTRQSDQSEFIVVLAEKTLLARPVLQDGHWIAEVSPEGSSEYKKLSVHRVDYLTQGIILPAGDWRVRFRYSPWWLGWSLAIGSIGWLAVIATALRWHFDGALDSLPAGGQRNQQSPRA